MIGCNNMLMLKVCKSFCNFCQFFEHLFYFTCARGITFKVAAQPFCSGKKCGKSKTVVSDMESLFSVATSSIWIGWRTMSEFQSELCTFSVTTVHFGCQLQCVLWDQIAARAPWQFLYLHLSDTWIIHLICTHSWDSYLIYKDCMILFWLICHCQCSLHLQMLSADTVVCRTIITQTVKSVNKGL